MDTASIPTTDIVISGSLLFFMWRGAIKGFLRTILGPLSFIVGTAAAYIYYLSSAKNVNNMCIAIIIGIFGPIFLSWCCFFIMRSSNEKHEPNFLSRMLGAALSSIWGMVLILPIVFILSMLPTNLHPALAKVHDGIEHSFAFSFTKRFSEHFNKLVKTTPSVPITPAAPKTTQAHPSDTIVITQKDVTTIQDLAQDERMQALLQDPAIMQAAQDKNYMAMMANPKVMAIAQDPALVKQLFSAYAEMSKNPPKTEENEEELLR